MIDFKMEGEGVMEYKNTSLKNTRNSSIELIKVIAIILIVISHVVQTLSDTNNYRPYQDYVVNLRMATTNIQFLILSILRYSGAIGNTIFFMCSAWYLLDSTKVNKRKILQMLMDIWCISVIFLIIVSAIRGNIGFRMSFEQLFPTFYGNNWYMTCYLLFYPIHPYLNMIISNLKQETLLKLTMGMLILYFGLCFWQPGYLFENNLILWIVIYFTVAYIKYYLVDISNNRKINICLFLVGFIGNCGMILITNVCGLHIVSLNDRLLYWNTNGNPFILLMAIGLLNIARNVKIESKIINYVSQLSMLIYIIHENVLLRTYYRPMLWQYVYENIGYRYILFWTFCIVLIVFLFGLISSIVYKYTVQKCVIKIGDILYPLLARGYNRIEERLLRLK